MLPFFVDKRGDSLTEHVNYVNKAFIAGKALPIVSSPLANVFKDVKGRSLFEGGNNSPYAAFFQFPYPLFYLTIKGYLGKAVRLPLMLEKFGSSFDPSTGNFRVRLEMKTYKYTIMSHVTFGAMMGTPLMYKSIISTKQTQPNNSTNNSTAVVKTFASEGYQKMKELYSEYKSKGLIDDNFPEITIQQLKYRLDRFIKNIIDSFKKTNLNVLNNLNDYETQLTEYEGYVFFYTPDSWSKTYLGKIVTPEVLPPENISNQKQLGVVSKLSMSIIISFAILFPS